MIALDFLTGDQACTISTEHTLNTPDPSTTSGIFQLFLDVNALVAGDVLEIRIKEKAKASASQRVFFADTLANARGADGAGYATPALTLGVGWTMTLKQTAGTGRTIPWSIRRIS